MTKTQMPSVELVVTLLVAVVVVVRHVAVRFGLGQNGYPYVAVTGFALAYAVSGSPRLSCLLALVFVYARAAYRYACGGEYVRSGEGRATNATMFLSGTLGVVVAAYALRPHAASAAVSYATFVMLVYTTASVIEWLVHKYVMHCYMHWPWLMRTGNMNVLTPLRERCRIHHDHHLSVNHDMTLAGYDDDGELLMHWSSVPGILLFSPLLMLVARALKLNIPWQTQLVIFLGFALFFGVMWNSMHPKMHSARTQMSAMKGPADLGLPYPQFLHDNHALHHTIKGKQKGNYNVVFVGADEFFGTNKM